MTRVQEILSLASVALTMVILHAFSRGRRVSCWALKLGTSLANDPDLILSTLGMRITNEFMGAERE